VTPVRTLLFLIVPSVALAQPEPPPPDITPMRLPVEPKREAEPAPPPKVEVTYDNGLRFESEDGKVSLKLTFRNQLRFESTRPTEDGSQFESRFLVPRSRFQVEGHVFGKDLRYKLEFGLGDNGSFSFVRDLFVDQKLADGPVWLRAGIWRRPFNRQEMVSDFASEFNERAITAPFVGGGRDIGIGLHNEYDKSPEGLEWVVGVFNAFNGGADRPDIGGCETEMGETSCPPPTNFPDDFAPAIVARAGWNDGEVKGYSEGDLEGGPLRWGFGASYKIDLANLAKGDEESVGDNLSHGLEIDAMFKAHGASLELGAYMMKLKSNDAGFGALVQAGYFVVPKRFQIAGRFAIAPAPGDRDDIEARVAANMLFRGHAWKWMTDAGVLQTTGEDPVTMESDKPDLVVRSMLQLTL
jgi:phosphate-selective porin OprO and OprP